MSGRPAEVPEERGPSRLARVLFKLAGILLLVASLGGGWLSWEYQVFTAAPLKLERERSLLVPPGTSVRSLGEQLAAHGILGHPRYFALYARLHGQAARIKAGEYLLTPGMTPVELLDLLVAGRSIQYPLTLVEGWNFAEVRRAVAGHPQLEQTLAGLADDELMTRLGHPGLHPEGRFFPDTYHFPKGTSDLEFLRRALRAMERVLAEEWAGRAEGLPLEGPEQALVLASIIEKETGVAAERAEIAGVFVRRLRKGMLLQTDPTVIYGLGEAFDGNLTRRHLRSDTPYNTYTRKGLPPTPIAMPGRAALHAALHPAAGEALYFVARGDGSHHFSATLEEHNRAVVRYQLKGRRRATTAPEG